MDWRVWRRISTDENGTHIATCNTESGTACDGRLCWRINAFVALATWGEVGHSCSIHRREFCLHASRKVNDYFGRRLPWFPDQKVTKSQGSFTSSLLKAEMAITVWSTPKDSAFTADCQAVTARARQPDEFFAWQFWNLWKIEDAASWFDDWREDPPAPAQLKNWFVEAGNHRRLLAARKRNRIDAWRWPI